MNKISIFGTPRSGTSWLAHIFNSHPGVSLRYQPLFSFGHKGSLSDNSTTEEIQAFFEEILNSQDSFALMETEIQKNYPKFQKHSVPSHIVFKETRYLNIISNLLHRCSVVKVIGIVRNPLAVLASWISTPKEFNPKWNLLNEWRDAPSKNQGRPEEFFGYNKWKETAEAFLRFEQQFPRQFMLINYNELNAASIETTKKLFSFCQLDYCQQVEYFVNSSKSRHDSDPYSVYKLDTCGSKWQQVLPQEIISAIHHDLDNTTLEAFM